ncbi:MAG: hypothetical protein HC919_09190 [Oscillatoriales cyanobacterium SM2_2_1]|nr:hypothetical protein [Oscillatoriales cyanobacterium SM2_2_1]
MAGTQLNPMDRQQRWLWILLTVVAAGFMALSLWSSWQRPQELSRLDLRQNDLLLQVVGVDSGEQGAKLVRAVAAGGAPDQIFAQTQDSYRRAWLDHLGSLKQWRAIALVSAKANRHG